MGESKLPPHLARYAGTGAWSDRTLGDLAVARAAERPDAAAFVAGDATITRAGALDDALALAAGMARLGVKPGDVVALLLPNWAEAATINLACALGGFVAMPIVPIYRHAEVGFMLADSDCRLAFVADVYRGFAHRAMVEELRAQLPGLIAVVPVRPAMPEPGDFADLLGTGRGGFDRPQVDADAVKLRLYTSGTTGRPKAVLHSHNTMERVERVSFGRWGVGDGEAILMPSPVTHTSGYANGLEQPFVSGTTTVLMEQWQADEAVALIDRHRAVGTVAATPFLQELADAALRAGSTLPSFRFFACGGASVPPALVERARATLGRPCAFRVFGSSEVPLVTLGFAPADPRAATTDGEIVDYEVRVTASDGSIVAAGGEGEIEARGPAMLIGYADPAQTAEAITADGWFRTGDLGVVDAGGAVTITGRAKDLIIRGGENLSPREIEEALVRHPAVREAAVVAIPHARLGEGVGAFLIAAAGERPDAATLAAFLAESGLAKQKTPERWWWVEDLPRTASGKVRKDQLRATAAAEMAE